MNEMTQWNGGSAPMKRNKAANTIVQQTKLAGLEIDALAALHGKAIERVCDVYDHAALLAESRPELKPLLMGQVFAFNQAAVAHIRNHNSPFGF